MEAVEKSRLALDSPALAALADELAEFAEPRDPPGADTSVTFQVIDSTYRVLPAHASDVPARQTECVVRLYGRSTDGHSVCVDVRGFDPYFYVALDDAALRARATEDTAAFLLDAAQRLEQVMQGARGFLRRVELVQKVRMYGYHTEPQPYLKVVLSNPQDVTLVRDAVGGALPGCGELFECNVPFCARFAIDTGMCAAGYVTVPAGALRPRTAMPAAERVRVATLRHNAELYRELRQLDGARRCMAEASAAEARLAREDKPQTYCQVEGVAHYEALVYHDTTGRPSVHPRVRQMFVDIEVSGVPLRFSQPDLPENKVVSVCWIVRLAGESAWRRIAQVLGEATKPPNVDHIFCYPNERTLLMAVFALLRIVAPDITSGYNSTNYDMWYLYERARYLGLMDPGVCDACFGGQAFCMLGRERGYRSRMVVEEFESGAVGKLEYWVAETPGIIGFDVLIALRRDTMFRPRDYSLGTVSEMLLTQNREGLTFGALWVVAQGCTRAEMEALAYADARTAKRLCAWSEERQRYEPTPRGTKAVQTVCALRGRPDEELTLRAVPWVYDGVAADVLRACDDAATRAAVERFCTHDAAAGRWVRTPRGVGAVNRVTSVKVSKALMTYSAIPFFAEGGPDEWLDNVERAQATDRDTRALVREYCRPGPGCAACHAPADPKRCACAAAVVPSWHATPASRGVLAEYCMMDTHLAWRLASVRKYLENAAEAANITYTALPRQIKGGQSERIMATIIAKVRTDGAPFLFPFYRPPNLTKEEKRRRKKAFKGAAVLPMHCEFICDAVPVGDYAGLYPSIMIYYNLCYTTYVAPDRLEAVRAHHRATYGRDGLHQSPAGHWFVDADIRVGLVPAQLRIVLAARSAAKKQNAAEAAIVRQYRVSAKWVEAADWRAALAEAAAAGGDVRDAFKTPEAAAAFVEAALAAAAASGVDAGVHWARELAEHDALAAAYDAKQAALKVLANSMYGFTGAEIGKLPCTPVSESVTSYGRAMIMRIKDMAERRNPETGRYCCDPDSPDPAHRAGLTAYRTEVIYGDSVTGDTPVVVRDRQTQAVCVMRIDELASQPWTAAVDGKEFSTCRYDAWTEDGWTPIRRVIRHAIPAEKPLWEVLTHTGCVRATDDHSLLAPDGARVRCSAVGAGTRLLHAPLPAPSAGTFADADGALLLGLFFADGTCGDYACPSGRKASWSISKDNLALMEQMLVIGERFHPGTRFAIYDTRVSSGTYRLCATNATSIAAWYRSRFYDADGMKRVPTEILNGTDEVRAAFLRGYYMGDGDKDGRVYMRMDVRGQIGAAGLFFIMNSLGMSVSMNKRADKPEIFRLTATRAAQRRAPDVVKKVRVVPHTGVFVFDLETESHHFQAGAGRMIVHNTDSAFVRLHGCGDMREATAFNEAMCSMITASFGDASVRLEAEKVLAEWLGFGPKRYCTLQFELTRAGEGIVRVNAKGFELVRRDTCRVLQQVLETCVAYVFPHGDRAGLPPDIPAAVAYVREVIAKMFRGEIAVADYAITKGVKCAPEAYLSVPAHITFAMRRREKYGDAAPPVEMGTRLVYVMVDRVGAIPAEKAQAAKAKGAAVDMADYMEDVGHAAAHPDTTPIAVGWYLEKQFRKPFSRFFASLLFSDPQMPKEVRRERAWSHLFNDPELQRALAQAQQRRGQLARQSGPMARFLTSTPAAPVRRAAPAAPAAPAPAAATPKRGKTIAEYFARK